MQPETSEGVIAVIGIGYVGLPLAVEFGKVRSTIGYDSDQQRIAELLNNVDRTMESSGRDLQDAEFLSFTSDPEALQVASIYIITVPTPIDVNKRPNLEFLQSASETVGRYLAKGNLVVFESTVYPGVTDDVCIPLLEKVSGLRLNDDFFVGYSPERINPGDRSRSLTSITKITSGSSSEAAAVVDDLYAQIIRAGTYRASSIRVAEAAKVIENVQRDVNIALVNELAILFDKLELDSHEVLVAASTKWNFLPFQPGLVGGHCIGVDPYYLTHKAQEVGFHPEIILAGRRVNDGMGIHVADQVVLLMARKGQALAGAKVLVLGLAFKENCPDIRNTGVINVVRRLNDYGIKVDVVDPWVSQEDAQFEYGIDLVSIDDVVSGGYSAAVLAVAHDEFLNRLDQVRLAVGEQGVIFDVKGKWDLSKVDGRL
jgi:UDP-N-acetyl-D-galactosamine dehydrogenase